MRDATVGCVMKAKVLFTAIGSVIGLLIVVGLTGCGFGAGDKSVDATVTVTDDFGARQIGVVKSEELPESETVLRLLRRGFLVSTALGDKLVQSITGVRDPQQSLPVKTAKRNRLSDKDGWIYYVNGIESTSGAAGRRVANRDRIWWDRHGYTATSRIPAVVGSFPEPFRSGINGKRLPVRIDCASDAKATCDLVHKKLTAAGARAQAKGMIGQSAGIEVLRLVVGKWRDIRRDPTVAQLERGPKTAGVFARPSEHGDRFDLLDGNGAVARKVGKGVGLVAATRFVEQQPTWVVTGIDSAGVHRAANALTTATLKNRFAVAALDRCHLSLPIRQSEEDSCG